MRTTFLGILLLCVGFVFGQTPSNPHEVKVYYKYNHPQYGSVATVIINNKVIANDLSWINPSDIKEIIITKNDKVILGKKSPLVLITMKDSIQLNMKMISLTEIKKKYIKSTSPYCIYLINERVIAEKVEDTLINENCILSMSVDKVKSKDSITGKEIEIEVIEILTDTKENIEKSKEIRLR